MDKTGGGYIMNTLILPNSLSSTFRYNADRLWR